MLREVLKINNSITYDKGLKLIYKYVKKVFPEVSRQLKVWAELSSKAECEELGKQALASLHQKRFHAQGGSVFALYPGVDLLKSVRFIVALQTISDYLDNLCDRAGVRDEAAFRHLHLSMLDAVDPKRSLNDYYQYYPYKNDNGYLKCLVEECRSQIEGLPSYSLVVNKIKKYVQLYSDLQTYKHLDREIREDCLKTWANYYTGMYPGISNWEFSAATGSTLGIFVLFAAAFNPELTAEEVKAIDSSYFPWICSLHILLDYYIDAQEDLQMGDLNFTSYYRTLKQCEERLVYFIEHSLECCADLQYPEFHTTVVKGLLAMYLSDPKAIWGLNRVASRNVLNSSAGNKIYYNLCRILRFAKVI